MPRLQAGWRAEGAVRNGRGSWVLLTHEHGVWSTDSAEWQNRSGEVDAYLREHRTNCLLQRGEEFCIGTSHGGIINTRDFVGIDILIGEAEGLARACRGGI